MIVLRRHHCTQKVTALGSQPDSAFYCTVILRQWGYDEVIGLHVAAPVASCAVWCFVHWHGHQGRDQSLSRWAVLLQVSSCQRYRDRTWRRITPLFRPLLVKRNPKPVCHKQLISPAFYTGTNTLLTAKMLLWKSSPDSYLGVSQLSYTRSKQAKAVQG